LERKTDIEKQEGISNDYMKNLYIFINDKKDEQKDNKDELTENLCSTSNQKTDSPDLYGFYKTLLFLVNNGFLINFLKK